MLLGAQSVHWIDARSSPRWDHAGTQRHKAKEGDAGGEAGYVEWTDFKQQACKSACQGERRADPEERSCCNENGGFMQHAGDDASSRRTERNANAEFASSLRRGVRDHAINPDGREQEAQSRERAQEEKRITTRSDGCGEHFLDAADFLHRFIRPDAVNAIAKTTS